MSLNWRVLWRAAVIVFLLFVVVCPFTNYRDRVWLVILSVGISAPFLLLSTIFLVASLVAILYHRQRIAVAAIIAALASFSGALFLVFLHPDLPIFRTPAYAMIDERAFATLIILPILLGSVPVVALILSIKLAFAKLWRSTLNFAAVPVAGVLLFFFSDFATNLLTVWSCAGPIQSALQTVRIGGHLPEQSQQYPIAVLHTTPDIAVESIESFMDFPSFIAYDTEDRPAAAVAARVRKREAPGCEYADARKVWGDYYWVSIVC